MLMWKRLLFFHIQWKGARNADIQWEYVNYLDLLQKKKKKQELFHIVSLQKEQQSTMQLLDVFSHNKPSVASKSGCRSLK